MKTIVHLLGVACCWSCLVLSLVATQTVGRNTAAANEAKRPFGENVQFRGNLQNSRARFDGEKKGRVAFIGGSITEMNGYRPMVCESLKKQFPKTEFTFVDAGI